MLTGCTVPLSPRGITNLATSTTSSSCCWMPDGRTRPEQGGPGNRAGRQVRRQRFHRQIPIQALDIQTPGQT